MSKVRLFNGDCEQVLQQLVDENVKVDAIITDPPYEISSISGGGIVNTVKSFNKSLKQLEDDNIINGYDIEKFGELAINVMNEINIYFWCNKKQIPDYFNFWVDKHKCVFDILSWHKTNALPTYSNKYLSDTEYLLYFRKGKGKCFPQTYEDAKTYFLRPINATDKKQYKHPTIKPLEITETIIKNSTKEGQTVLDPFMGSGTTGAACRNLKRNFVGVELNTEYFNIAKERILGS